MAEIKTKQTDADVSEFINSFADTEQKRKDSFELVKLMQGVTGCEAKMWGANYHRVWQLSLQIRKEPGRRRLANCWFLAQESGISLMSILGGPAHEHLLKNLGKFKMGKACIYIKKLSDINQDELIKLMKETIHFIQSKYQK